MKRLYEKLVDGYFRVFPPALETRWVQWNFLRKSTVRHVFASVHGVKILLAIAQDPSGHIEKVCHARGFPGHLAIEGFYHGGKLYPARLFNLYLKVGLCKANSSFIRG